MNNKLENSVIENALHSYATLIYNRITKTDDKQEFLHSLKEGKKLLKSDLDFGCLDVAVALEGGVKQRKKFQLDTYGFKG
jgi:hypothetical protein